ncbi:hypothetical protein SAMN04488503_3182 [Humidesulfovibrio mexicanus]|jgi:hypothetical protein|uniref:Uncharacterized protein n=1 Tax=Humidesulfovibrio mexicanus TaxID=147047 RepID=A0A239CMT0_9BACT|nr:hypothetical protein [Humidesulfovibrio mexicanus]SNS20653.1 hypothetical protein SAMN04488503_3182 [Humidesulfovibrio mexicanus]
MKLTRLALSLALVLLMAGSALAAKATVHFVVVPAALPSEQLHDFNAFLVKNAGGYTVSRSTGGDSASFGAGYAPENLSYTVSAPKNLSREIGGYLKKELGLKKIFLLTWPAERLEE